MQTAPRHFGLTGGPATGKSTIAGVFRDLGARIIDADQIGHELLRRPQPAYREVAASFGQEILDSAGEIDRKKLGAIVFRDHARLAELNAILHPRIIKRTEELVAAYHAENPRVPILVDAALIFEAGIGGRFTKVIVAWCRPEQQIERLMAKTGLSLGEAKRRIAAQMPSEEKTRCADYSIDTSATFESTQAQVKALFPKLQRILEE